MAQNNEGRQINNIISRLSSQLSKKLWQDYFTANRHECDWNLYSSENNENEVREEFSKLLNCWPLPFPYVSAIPLLIEYFHVLFLFKYGSNIRQIHCGTQNVCIHVLSPLRLHVMKCAYLNTCYCHIMFGISHTNLIWLKRKAHMRTNIKMLTVEYMCEVSSNS